MSTPPRKSTQAAIDRATAWNKEHRARRSEINKKNYYKYRVLNPAPVLAERFHSGYMPVPESGCWIWTGKTNSNGYGEIRHEKRVLRVHRVSWQLHRGEIPSSTCVLHTCDVRCCVNPEHLFLGTSDDNMKDMASKDRSTHGEKSAAAKLKANEILEIRALRGSMRQEYIGANFGVHPSQISRIQTGKFWKRIGGNISDIRSNT